MKERLSSKLFNQTVTFHFSEDHIQQITPFSTSETKWHSFVEVQKVATGILLKPDVGLLLFLPKAAFESEEKMNLVYRKLKNSS